MSKQHNEKVFDVYATSLASVLHYDILRTMNDLDNDNAPDLYVNKIRKYLKSLSSRNNMENFVNFYSEMYDAWIAKEPNKLKKVKEFVNIWLPVNKKNNNTLNENYLQLLHKVNVNTINVLLQTHFISQAGNHIDMFLKSDNNKHQAKVRNFEINYNNDVKEAIKISCSKIRHKMDNNNESSIPIQQYIALQEEIKKLKQNNNIKIIQQLKAENEELKNKIEILELNSTKL